MPKKRKDAKRLAALLKELLAVKEQFQADLKTLEARQSLAVARLIAAVDANKAARLMTGLH